MAETFGWWKKKTGCKQEYVISTFKNSPVENIEVVMWDAQYECFHLQESCDKTKEAMKLKYKWNSTITNMNIFL